MDRSPIDTGRIYTVPIDLAALTTAPNEIVSLLASSASSRVELLRLELGQTSTGVVAAIKVELFRGTSASVGGSTGAAVTPVNRNGWAAAPAAASSASGPSTTPNSTANEQRFQSGSFDQAAGQYVWLPDFPETLDLSQRFHVRLTPLTTAVLPGIAGTLTFREVGAIPR